MTSLTDRPSRLRHSSTRRTAAVLVMVLVGSLMRRLSSLAHAPTPARGIPLTAPLDRRARRRCSNIVPLGASRWQAEDVAQSPAATMSPT